MFSSSGLVFLASTKRPPQAGSRSGIKEETVTSLIKGLEPRVLREVITSVEQSLEKNQDECDPITAVTGGLFIYKSKSQSAPDFS